MMSRPPLRATLAPADFAGLLSPYLTQGRRDDTWQIDGVQIDGPTLQAQVSMRSTFTSATDAGGFHLTVFTALEFASQLMIIYAHAWAGLERKLREGWMVESSTRSLRAIRSAQAIAVAMQVRSMRRRGEHLYCVADYVVSDDAGGRFEITLKGFLS